MDTQNEMGKMAEKSWLSRPDGKVGLVVGLGVLGAGAYGFSLILPWLISLLENTLYAGALAAALLVLTSPIWNGRIRTLCSYMYRSAMRAITGFFIELDPIGILKNYIEDLKKSSAKMEAQIANLQGSIQRLRNIILKNTQDAQHSLKLVAAAKGQEDQKSAFILNARKAGRLEKSNETLQSLLDKMTKLYKNLTKLSEVSSVMVADMESEVQVKEQERNAMRAGYGAFTAAMNILKGNPDTKALYDQAMEYLADDFAQKIGEIEHFMDVSQGFIGSIDLENKAFELEALDKLEALDVDHLLGNLTNSPVAKTQEEQSEVAQLFAVKH